MKKLLSILLVMLLTLGFAGCYTINSGTLNEVVGTYEMKSFTRTYNGKGSHEAGTVDYIKDKHAVSYVVVSESGIGYYIYKDDETPLTCIQLKMTFTPSTEHEGKYDYVKAVDGKGHESSYGIHARDKALNPPYLPAIDLGPLQRDYSESISYKRVDKAQDLSYVEKNIGKQSYAEFDNYKYHGAYVISISDNTYSDYICRYVIYDAVNKKATLKYALKSDCVAAEKEIDFTVNPSEYKITVDGNDYNSGYYIERHYLYPTEYGDVYITENMYKVEEEDIDDSIASEIENYLEQNNSGEAE